MQNDETKITTKALELWTTGQDLEAGRLLYENLATASRPQWAARILKLVLKRGEIQSKHFDRVLHIAEHDNLWARAHTAFSLLRAQTLKLDRLRGGRRLTEDEDLLAMVLLLAEQVAKVIYNATIPVDEFDEDCGWWVVRYLRYFVDSKWPDPEFADAAWAAISSEPGRSGG